MGNAYLYKKNIEKAIECYLESIKIDPKIPQTWNNLGTGYLYKNDIQKAIECYEK